ncbi:acyltransferase family protein [Arthrobacter sp. MI7-26]|uniref:acyltransferase family protein n=1 Tax=Arthrobacter sp. MI7-26 TaxID=2993653 RepID=UPI0022492AF6|nr:acyltransferase family protein [Arthrobacter sp. MI7-26]MCX2746229.1 acyltransferase family protein [Arthrobacter sp. MI7-26]
MTTTRALVPPRRQSETVRAAAKSNFRPEIQGLRSVAVLMVVTYHIWFGRVSGGVDVFLLISAFLMTLQFTRRYSDGRQTALIRHWLHHFRRLLPAAVTVIVGTLAATYMFMPATRWLDTIQQGWASLFYVENFLLQSHAVNYYAADHSLASPLQHFWSLSIQGQVFIVWPIILVGAGWAARRYRLAYVPLLRYIFGLVFLVSLVYSVVFTATDQAAAYFSTGARLWEFALGTLLALFLPMVKIPRSARIVLGWIGILAMLSCGFILDVEEAFPGWAALWPTLAAACLLAAGQTDSRFGVDRILSSKPLVRMGNNSYALYLWHWPMLVIYLAWSGKTHAGWLSGTVIIIGAFLLAVLTTKFVERPWREWKWPEVNRRRSVISLVAVATVAILPLTGWPLQIEQTNRALLANMDTRNPGAATVGGDIIVTPDPSVPLVPSMTSIDADWPVFPTPCKGTADAQDFVNRCTNGITNGTKSVVVIGSSHAHVLNTPLLTMAAKNNWSLTSITKGFCPLGEDTAADITQSCVDFNKATLAEVLRMKPDVVVTTSTRTNAQSDIPERLDPSWVTEVKTLNDAGIQVVALRDTPRTAEPVPACLEKNPGAYIACGSQRAEIYSEDSPTAAVAGELTNTKFLDLSKYFCPDANCPAVIGNVIVYKDDNHVTATYMKTLTPYFEKAFMAATGWS